MRIVFLFLVAITANFFYFSTANAAMRASLDGAPWQTSFTNPSAGAITGTQSFGKLSFSGRLDNKNKIWMGWQFLSISSVIKGVTETSTISSFDMGPYIAFDFGHEKIYSFNFFYGIKNTTSFNDGTGAVALSGASTNVGLSFNPLIGDDLGLVIGVNYYLATYTTSTLDKVQTSVSYSLKQLLPTLGLRYVW